MIRLPKKLKKCAVPEKQPVVEFLTPFCAGATEVSTLACFLRTYTPLLSDIENISFTGEIRICQTTSKSVVIDMAEELVISASRDKRTKYDTLLPQLDALVGDEKDLVANLANLAAALKQTMDFFWVGFYLVKDDQLVLGPFQGPVACTRIPFGKGVCGTCWKEEQTIIVPNVDEFPGHIACSSGSRSEIVLPAFKEGKVFLVLDVDSDKPNDFDETDRRALGTVMKLVEKFL